MTQNKTVSELAEEKYPACKQPCCDCLDPYRLKQIEAFLAGFDAAIEMLRSKEAASQDTWFTDKEEWAMTPSEWGDWLELQKGGKK